MYISHNRVRAQHGLEAKRECLDVEVVERPGASGERSSSSGCRDKRLLDKAEYTELVGDEIQTPLEEGLEWHEDGRSPHPIKWERAKLQRAEVNCIARACHAEDGGKVGHLMTKSMNARCSPHGRCQLSV